jgi:benzoyl-CoA reductase/2-hydroxyglutaryl-CoA dehydratase subunit BcrC/BadD/HgdB
MDTTTPAIHERTGSPNQIGITATVPVEIILAAGLTPVDLNNLFISSEQPMKGLALAEADGFPHGVCAWIKGIYATVLTQGIRQMIAVTGGDCSNTVALGEVLEDRGVRVIPFEYPPNRDRERLQAQMEALRTALSPTGAEVEAARARLQGIRAKLARLDRLTHERGQVSGAENHRFLVASSDFNGDPARFEQDLDRFLAEAQQRSPLHRDVRLGYLGVPPIFSDFYEKAESFGAGVVFNEVQRQFSMPHHDLDLVDQYLRYTYPYDVGARIADIEEAVTQRRLDGLIHYTQTFCYRQIYDVLLRERLSTPILTLEGDRPGPMDGRTALRLETFVEMLRDRKA